MGTLNPGATYIYERVDGVVYARETGSLKREAIGWNSDADPNVEYQRIVKESHTWREILTAARTNPVLQEALDRVKILYALSKQDGQE